MTSWEQHRIVLAWRNSYAPNTNHYGKILVRIQPKGKAAQQWDVDNGYTDTFTVGPWRPGITYVISVKGGYSYDTGYGYSNWATIVERAPDGAPAVVGWYPWYAIAPNGNVRLVPGGKVTPVWSNEDHLDLFAVDVNGHVVTTWWDKTTGWGQDWVPVGGALHDDSYPLMKPGAQVTAL